MTTTEHSHSPFCRYDNGPWLWLDTDTCQRCRELDAIAEAAMADLRRIKGS